MPQPDDAPRDDLGVRTYRPAEPAQREGASAVKEIGGRKDGTDPTRFGDWEKNGRCIDF